MHVINERYLLLINAGGVQVADKPIEVVPALRPTEDPIMSRPMVKGDIDAGVAYTLQRSWDLRDGFYVVTLEEHELSRQRRMAVIADAVPPKGAEMGGSQTEGGATQ